MIRKLLVLLLCLTAATATAKKPKSSASKKAESSAEKPKESDYDKLFKEKHTVADGMFRLHDVKGKLYFEIPDSLFGREMLLGSTISEVSDNAAATTGSKSDYPLHVVFTRNDRSVQLRTVNCENITDETGASRALAEAVKRNTADPILRNYKIEAWNRDSTAVVVNVTDLFVADVEEMSPFSKYGLYTAFELKKTFQTERSMLGEIKAFSDNVVVRSTLSYIFTLTRGRTTLVKDQPLTAVMTRSLVLLGPEGLLEVWRAVYALTGPLPYAVKPLVCRAGQPVALDALSDGWPAGATLLPVATKHRVRSLGYRLDLPRAGRFDPEKARALGVPVTQWRLLQRGQAVPLAERMVQPAEVLGAPRKGLRFVFSGDSAPCPALEQAAQGADLLLCDATYALPEQQEQAAQWGHSTFGQSAALAAKAGAKRLWLVHYSPMVTDPEEHLAQAQSVFPAAECGFDGKRITLHYEENEE